MDKRMSAKDRDEQRRLLRCLLILDHANDVILETGDLCNDYHDGIGKAIHAITEYLDVGVFEIASPDEITVVLLHCPDLALFKANADLGIEPKERDLEDYYKGYLEKTNVVTLAGAPRASESPKRATSGLCGVEPSP